LHWLAEARPATAASKAGTAGDPAGVADAAADAAAPVPSPSPGVDAVVDCAGRPLRGTLWQLGAALELPARHTSDLVEALTAEGRPRTFAVTGLHRAEVPELHVAALLAPLLRTPGVRLLVETDDGPTATALRQEYPQQPAVLDLDDPRWTDQDGFADWCAQLPAVGEPVDAKAVHPNPSAALLAAATPPARRAAAPAGWAEHARAWRDALPAEQAHAYRVLAASPRPLPTELWRLAAGAPGLPPEADAIATPTDAGEGQQLLRPAALRDLLLDRSSDQHPSADWAAKVASDLAAALPRRPDGSPDPTVADEAHLTLLLETARLAGTADPLLSDALFLVCADPLAVTTALPRVNAVGSMSDITGEPPAAPAQAWATVGSAMTATTGRAAAARAARARLLRLYLQLTRRGDDLARARLEALAGPDRDLAWITPAGIPKVLTAGHGPFEEGMPGWTSDADPVHLFSPADGGGRPTSGPRVGTSTPTQHLLPSRPLAMACTGDGYLLSVHDRGVLRVRPEARWDPGSEQTLPAREAERMAERLDGTLRAVATLPLRDTTLLYFGDSAGRVHRSDPRRSPGRLSFPTGHQGEVRALAVTLAGKLETIVSGGADGAVRVWQIPPKPTPADVCFRLLTSHPHAVTALAATGLPEGGLRTAACWADGLVRVCGPGESEEDLRLPVAPTAAVLDTAGHLHLATPDGLFTLAVGGGRSSRA